MRETLFDGFLTVDGFSARPLLLSEVQSPTMQMRRFIFNMHEVVIDHGRGVAIIEDGLAGDLPPEEMPIAELVKALNDLESRPRRW